MTHLQRRSNAPQIDWVVEEGFVDLVKLVRGVRQVIPFALRRWRKQPFAAHTWQEIGAFRRTLRETSYDYVIDTQGLVKTGWIARTARGAVWGLGNRTEGTSYEWPVRYLYQYKVCIEPHTHVVMRSIPDTMCNVRRIAQDVERRRYQHEPDRHSGC